MKYLIATKCQRIFLCYYIEQQYMIKIIQLVNHCNKIFFDLYKISENGRNI